MSTEPVSAPPTDPVTEDRTVAILAYITLIGFIVAIVLHTSNKKTALGAFHLRQALGLLITSMVVAIGGMVLAFIPILGPLAVFVIWIGLLVMWLMGLIAAINGRQKPMPVLGQSFDQWFKGAFA
jgi:uncharacterized membrane protein